MGHDHQHQHEHGHAHAHAHAHCHHHDHRGGSNRAFAVGIGLNAAFVVIELGFGLWANSLSLLSDAGHNLSDVLGLLMAWGASFLATRQPTARRTYGLRRSSILAALANAVLLLLAVGGIAWEAIQRLGRPEPVSGMTVVGVAVAGVVVNTVTALLFMSGRKHDLNLRGAYLHMAADAAVSAGVVVAGGIIAATGWQWVDPAVSLLVGAVILIGTWDLFRESLDLALDAVPAGIDPAAVEHYLTRLPGISAVHDLHVWGVSTTDVALTVHLVKPDGQLDDDLITRVNGELLQQFGIAHATIQLEQGGEHSCNLSTHGAKSDRRH